MKRVFFIGFLSLFSVIFAFPAALCDFPTGHLNDANFGDANGRILLSVESTGTNSVRVTVKPNYANGATKKLDYLYVISSSNIGNCSPYPAEAGVDESGSSYDELSVDLTYPAGSTTATFTIQWSNPSWGGRWQATPSGVDITSACIQDGYYLRGFNDYWSSFDYLFTGGGTVKTVSIDLAASTTYTFKLFEYNGGSENWYSNTVHIQTSNKGESWAFNTNTDNARITTEGAGTYTFSYNTSTKYLSVQYPVQTTTMYFINTGDWPTPKAHVWKNGGSNLYAWNAAASEMTNTSRTSTDTKSIWSYTFNGDYDKTIFHNGSGTQTGNLDVYDGMYYHYAHSKWCTDNNIYLAGTMNAWSTSANAFVTAISNTLTCTVSLSAATTYDFKLYQSQDNKYWGNSGTMTSADCTDWDFNDASNNCHITTTIAGEYTFTYDYTTDKLSVTYPVPPCSGTRRHFNSTGPQITYQVNYDATAKKTQIIVESVSSTMNTCDLDYRKTASGGETRVAMTILNGVATTTLSNFEPTDELHFRFHYSVVGTPGEYLTAEGTGNTEPNMIRLTPVSGCEDDLVAFVTEPATVPDDPDDLTDCEILSLFGLSTYSNKGLTEFQFWDGSPAGSREFQTIDGKQVCYVHGQPAGKYAIMSDAYDVTDYDKFHVDLWTPNTGKVHIRLMGYSGGWQEATNYREYNAIGGTWLSIDANVSDFTFANPALAKANMKGLMIIDMSPSMCNYHVANMYFYKSASDESCYADCGVDVARGKQTWSGCYENVNTKSEKAVDGTNDMWQTGGGAAYANQWWVVDLGRCYDLDKIVITFENARTKHMRLQTRKETPTPAQMASDAAWTTIVDVSGANDDGSGTILGNWNLNEYDVSDNKARYIRFKSDENTHNNAYGCKIRMFKVCVTGVSVDDANPPTMVSAEYISNNVGNTGAILELHATDLEGDVSRFRLNEVGGGSTTLNTDASNRATLDGLASGSHTYHVYAIDAAGNVSANYETLNICFVNPAENLALNKTCYAGHECANPNETKEKANDGLLTTYWTSWEGVVNTDDWWYVDLGNIYTLSEIDLYWDLDGVQRLGSEDYIIQVRQTAPVGAQVTNEDEWTTVAHETSAKCGRTEGTDKNSYPVNIDARYVRVQSKQRNSLNAQIRLIEMQVYGSSCGTLDNTAPVLTASKESTGVGQVVLNVSATDAQDGAIYDFYVTNSVTGTTSIYTDDNHDGKITITGLDNCVTYSFTVRTKDKAVNWSNSVVISSVTPMNDHVVNIALGKTTTAGYTEGDAVATTANAVDGDNNTQWNSTGATAGTNEWFTVDLGTQFDLNEVKILWSKTGATDDGRTYPVNFKLQVSADNTNFTSFAHYTETTAVGTWLDYTTTDPLPARYVRVWVDTHSAYSMGIREIGIYAKDACFSDNGKPVITLAEMQSVAPTEATFQCDAFALGKTLSEISFYYELKNTGTGTTERTGTISTSSSPAHVNGLFTLSNLTKGAFYELKVWAVKNEGSVRSDNYKTVTFNVAYSSLHYLTEETACNWLAGVFKSEWQFEYTDNYSPTELDGSGNPLQVLSYIDHTVVNDVATTPPSIQYKLYEAGYGSVWTTGGNLFFRNPKGKHLIMYALGTEKFVCNFDELYISGEAVGGWWTDTYAPNSAYAADYRMTYDNETGLFKWTGDVVPGAGKYFKICIRDIRGVSAAADTWAFSRIMGNNQVYERDWTRATLYFDMKTWTWWWENAMGGCTREGGPGTINTDNDGTAFTDGYKFDTYVQRTAGQDYLVVEAEPFDAALDNAGALQMYYGPTADVYEVTAKETKQYHELDGTAHTYYRYKVLISSIPTAINGIIRYKVKFEGPAGLIRNTLYHYFNLNNKVCAPDFNVFYHSADPNVTENTVEDPADAVYEFNGGQLVQPIIYRRKFDPGEWHTICIPFIVDSVRVWDDGDKKYYKLEPLWMEGATRHDAQYWLRSYDNDAPPTELGFKENWEDPTTAHYVPQKDYPYIIRFPKGNYYKDKYVEFVGRWYQTIATEAAFSRATVDVAGTFIYAGNNTMKRITMAQPAYYLNDDYTIGDQQYFVQRETAHTLLPFECYVVSDLTTMGRVKIIGRAKNTPTDLDDLMISDVQMTDYTIYSVTGQMIVSYKNKSLHDITQLCQDNLASGCYILKSSDNTTLKLIVGSK